MRKKLVKFTTLAIIASMSLSMFSGCGSKASTSSVSSSASSSTSSTGAAVDNSKLANISIMLTSYTSNTIADNSPILKKLQEATNTKLTFTWIPSTSYADKLNITLASGNLPNILLIPDKSASILSGVKAGAFWEIGPYLKDYANLSQMNPDVMWNTSINGKYYGLYRARPYGRNGITFRKDWLANVGLTEPKTLDDFYAMLKAFTNGDPDKDGKADTYGMAASKSNMAFGIMLPWFGAPNKWGADKDGKLAPDFTTTAYVDCLKYWKKMYSDKLINQDFAVFEPTKVADLFNTGKVGALIDVADAANRADDTIFKTTDAYKADSKAKVDPVNLTAVDVMGSLTGPLGNRNLPTSGYNGMFMFPKSSNKTEADLKRVLRFMDDTCSTDMSRLIGNGLEGVQFNLVNGFTVSLPVDQTIFGEINQLALGVPPNLMYVVQPTPIRIKTAKVQDDNIKTAVANPAEPYVSQTYSTKGAQLDNIIEDARVKYIVGQIDDKGFADAVALWKKSGGDEVIKEYGEQALLYKKK